MKRQKMRTEQKSNVKNSVGRLVFVGLSLLLQVLWILLLFLRLNAYSTAISLCFSVGAFLVALSIYAKHENAAFKMPWINSDSGVSGAGALHISGVRTQECGGKGDA